MRATGFAMVGATYAVAFLVAWGIWAWLPGHPIVRVLVADLVATIVVFAVSRWTGNSSMYDAYWSVVPPIIVLAWWGDGDVGRALWAAIAVWLWGIRLTYNWASGWTGMEHEDWRYLELKEEHGARYWWVSFGGIHLFPTVQVFLGCLPLWPILNARVSLGFWDAMAALLLFGAVALETAADHQLHAFLRRDERGPFCDEGLWAWCRHPNYLGEMSFWWGLYALGLAADPSWWWSGVGALSITLMFVFVSAPWLDRRNVARRPGYEAYMAKTWSLVPFPPRS